MSQFLKLRRSSVPGKIPTTSSLDFGELALNTYDGSIFMRKSGSNGDEIISIGTAPTSSLIINLTPIISGSSGNILFESASKISESSNLTYIDNLFKIVGTTEQFRIGYDENNYTKITVNSTGSVVFSNTGSGEAFVFKLDDTTYPAGFRDTFTIEGHRGGYIGTYATNVLKVKGHHGNVIFTVDDMGFIGGGDGAGNNYHWSNYQFMFTGGRTLLSNMSFDGNRSEYMRFYQPGGYSSWIKQDDIFTNSILQIKTEDGLLIKSGLATNRSFWLFQGDTFSQYYDMTNFTTKTISSTGLVTYDAVGSGAGFQFNKDVILNNLTGSSALYLDSNKKIKSLSSGSTGDVFGISGSSPVWISSINWDTAYSWGNHANAGYLTSFTESDPIFNTWLLTTANPANWDTAYSWGNHANAGYLTSFTEADPIFNNWISGSPNISLFTNNVGYITSVFDPWLPIGGDIYFSGGRVGIGTPSVNASLEILQSAWDSIRISYDNTNYTTTLIGSNGLVTYDAVGSGAGFQFNKDVILNSLTSSSAIYLDSSKKIKNVTAGSTGDVLTLSGDIPVWSTPSSGITIDSTTITSGGSGRILFESGTNKISESADLTYASGLLKIVGTSEQLRVGYDGSNYIKVTVGSTGLVTYDAVGSGAGHYFADKVLLGTTNNTDQSLMWINGAGGLRVGTTRINDINGENLLRGNTYTGGDNVMFDSYGRICVRVASGRAIYYGTTYPPPASVGIGMASTTQGIGVPSMTGAQAEAISGLISGIVIHCNNGNGASITTTGFWGYDAGTWVKLS